MQIPDPWLQQSIQTTQQYIAMEPSLHGHLLEEVEEEEAVFENYTCGNEFYAGVIKLKF